MTSSDEKHKSVLSMLFQYILLLLIRSPQIRELGHVLKIDDFELEGVLFDPIRGFSICDNPTRYSDTSGGRRARTLQNFITYHQNSSSITWSRRRNLRCDWRWDCGCRCWWRRLKQEKTPALLKIPCGQQGILDITLGVSKCNLVSCYV